MHILLDGYNLGLVQGTGVATYGRNLSHIIKQSGQQVSVLYGKKTRQAKNPLLKEVAFFDAAVRPAGGYLGVLRGVRDAFSAPLGCEVDTVPISGRVIFDSLKYRLPEFDQLWNSHDLYSRSMRSFRWLGEFARLSVPGVDIAHWTYPLPVRAHRAANVYTIHDLIPLRLPQTTLDNKNRYFKLCMRIARTADHIITVSEASRRDIINLLGANPDKVTNTYQSVNFPQHLMAKSDAVVRDELAGTFNLAYKGYFLYFGAVEPKKNLGRLIEAYLGSGVATPLVIVGAPGWKTEDEMQLLDVLQSLPNLSQDKRNRIIRLEYLPFPMLMSMIRGAKATLFPSLYEGFGLPVLESMALGTAVLTSDVSSLPEIAGDAACLVDPYDTRAMAQAIQTLDVNEGLRRELEAKGRERAKMFSEEIYARRLNDVYAQILSRKGR